MCTRALCAAVLLLPVLPHASWLDVDPEGDEVPEIYMRTRPRARSHIATDLSDGEMNTFSTIRSRARYFNLTGVEIVDNSDSGHDYPFNMPSWPGIGPFLSDGVTRRSFSRLNLDKQANDESVKSTRVDDSLGKVRRVLGDGSENVSSSLLVESLNKYKAKCQNKTAVLKFKFLSDEPPKLANHFSCVM